ncbi:hypothetical protein COL922a_012432 [Colletotrichum nupharicola]|nr:hypothetical protein COL922a_012432 [Colletotrichum nupharicola]
MQSLDQKIIIIGAGVFGLSTALWIARGGYKDITIFDRCAFDKNFYDPSNGCDGASADINKVFRMAYGDKLRYQNLALEAKDMWLSWNKAVAETASSDLPAGLSPEDKLLHLCGAYFLAEGSDMRDYYAESLELMSKTAPDHRKMLFVKGDTEDEERLRNIDPKWVEKYHIIDKINSSNTNGFIDINAGVTIADKACVYARFLCEKEGIKFVLGDPQGKLEKLIIEDKNGHKKVAGLQACDGLSHYGDLVIVADGFWRYYQGGGLPISKEGRLKFGFRGRKPIDTVPLYGLCRMKEVIAEAFPELVEFGFTDSRLCWYTDSIDNDYVIDYVPGYSKSLFICTGGSGHAFKFLPILGRHVKNQLEGISDEFTPFWKWRVAKEGHDNNGLSEGEDGPREVSKVEMADRADFKLEPTRFA